MSKRDKKRLDQLSELGCVVCRVFHKVYSPPAIHHLRSGVGMGQRSGDDRAIPLCPNHHQYGGYGVALHAGQKQFEHNYATEDELLEMTNTLLGGME